MKKAAVVLGDSLSGGGSVTKTSQNFIKINGLPIATIDDEVTCAIHGYGLITEGFEEIKVNKKPVAYDGCKTSCGCTIIAKLGMKENSVSYGSTRVTPIEIDDKTDGQYSYQFYIINPIDGTEQNTNVKIFKLVNNKYYFDQTLSANGMTERIFDNEKNSYIALIGDKKNWWYGKNYFNFNPLPCFNDEFEDDNLCYDVPTENQTPDRDNHVIDFYFYDGRDCAISYLEVYIKLPGAEEIKYITKRNGCVSVDFFGQEGQASVKVRDLTGEIQLIANVKVDLQTDNYLFRSPKVLNYFKNYQKSNKNETELDYNEDAKNVPWFSLFKNFSETVLNKLNEFFVFNEKNNVQTDSFNNNIEEDSFNNNIEEDSFNNNIEEDSFNNNIEEDSFNNNIEENSFNSNIEEDSFNSNIQTANFNSNIQTANFNSNIQTANFNSNIQTANFNSNIQNVSLNNKKKTSSNNKKKTSSNNKKKTASNNKQKTTPKEIKIPYLDEKKVRELLFQHGKSPCVLINKNNDQVQFAIGPIVDNEDNLYLGCNIIYKNEIKLGAQASDLSPQAIATIINCEAAKKYQQYLIKNTTTNDETTFHGQTWDQNSKSTQSSAAGLTQILAKTWVDEILRKNSLINKKCITEMKAWIGSEVKENRYQFIFSNTSKKYPKNMVPADLLPTTNPNMKKCLDLRLNPEWSILAAVDFNCYYLSTALNIALYSKYKALPDNQKVKILYLLHHEGVSGFRLFMENIVPENIFTMFGKNVLPKKEYDQLVLTVEDLPEKEKTLVGKDLTNKLDEYKKKQIYKRYEAMQNIYIGKWQMTKEPTLVQPTKAPVYNEKETEKRKIFWKMYRLYILEYIDKNARLELFQINQDPQAPELYLNVKDFYPNLN